jgi:hypothetical protein
VQALTSRLASTLNATTTANRATSFQTATEFQPNEHLTDIFDTGGAT